MVQFKEITKEQRELLKTIHPYFHGFLCLYAHQLANANIKGMHGIFKFEGGVTLNNHEIVIYSDSVRDCNNYDNNIATPEEQYVVNSIIKLLNDIDFTNEQTVEDSLIKIYENLTDIEKEEIRNFLANPFRGDSLHSFLKM